MTRIKSGVNGLSCAAMVLICAPGFVAASFAGSTAPDTVSAADRAKAAQASCKTFSTRKPKSSKLPVTLTITNATGESRAIMQRHPTYVWTDVAMLQPGQSTTVTTFATHPLMFTDGPGNCIETLVVSQGQTNFAITVPSPGFGPE